jgi:glycosyltransferase involved in cell wall biosynthesis
MKAAIVYHFFPHYRAAVLRELLRSTAHEYLLVADEKPWDATIKPWTVEDRARFLAAPCRKLISPFLFQKGLIGLGLRRDLDAVIYLGNPYFVSTWLSALLARLAGKRVLFWTHGWTRADQGIKAWLRSTFYKLSHGLLLYGHSAKMSGLAHGFPLENLHVVYNSLDYEKQKAVRESIADDHVRSLMQTLFKNPNWPIVICSARLSQSCRFDLLLEAQAQLRDEGHPLNVLLIGDGPEREALRAQAERLRLPVHFYGACYDEAVLAHLTMGAHVTVSPGKIGLTAMQSLAYGTPVITHDDFEEQGPEWEAIVPGRTGDFFRRGDVADLARVIRAWTDTPLTRPEICAECHRVLERFYNPAFQRRAIDRAISGQPADDLFWLKESLT